MNIRIAIIEDQKEIREMLELIINGTPGYECSYAFSDAEEAIALISNWSVDIVLVDIHLPGNSGTWLVEQAKPICHETQFLMYTSLDDSDTIFEALKAGANGYITKSTPPAKVLEAITEIHLGGSPMNSYIARKVISSFSPVNKANNSRETEELTSRERQIVEQLSKGFRYKEIANSMFISIDTVRTHIRNIYQKLQVNSAMEAVNKVFQK